MAGKIVIRHLRQSLAGGSTVVVALGLLPTVRAHEGTVHAGTPHWLLLGLTVVGLGVLVTSFWLGRGRTENLNSILGAVFFGALLIVIGMVGLTEIQVEPLGTNPVPIPRTLYSFTAIAVGGLLVLVSLNLGIWRWSNRPEYAALGVVLGSWILYPQLFPLREYQHPLGYALVLSVPLIVGYVFLKDLYPALRETGRLDRWVGLGASLVFVVFLLFSTGQFTLNPEEIAANPGESFVVINSFANPLVLWPAVEFYYPSIPMFGAISVGTVITFALLAGLVGINAALATLVKQSGVSIDRTSGVFGGLATTGATACCCCAPAAYGIGAAVLGVSASPLYWAFLDPQSPLGTIFFASATVLMTASGIQLAHSLDKNGICSIRN